MSLNSADNWWHLWGSDSPLLARFWLLARLGHTLKPGWRLRCHRGRGSGGRVEAVQIEKDGGGREGS